MRGVVETRGKAQSIHPGEKIDIQTELQNSGFSAGGENASALQFCPIQNEPFVSLATSVSSLLAALHPTFLLINCLLKSLKFQGIPFLKSM